jgi:hypothetical protein
LTLADGRSLTLAVGRSLTLADGRLPSARAVGRVALKRSLFV